MKWRKMSARFWSIAGGFGIALYLVICYFPRLRHYFYIEDYLFLWPCARQGLVPEYLFGLVDRHFMPVFKLLFYAEYRLFGGLPAGYAGVSLLLHTVNTGLAVVFYRRLFQSRAAGNAAGILFGLSSAYWGVVVEINLQHYLFSMLFFLLSALAFLAYLRQHRIVSYVGAALSHLVMIFTFSNGIEVPFIFFLLAITLSEEKKKIKKLTAGAAVALPFFLNAGLGLWVRELFSGPGSSALEQMQAITMLSGPLLLKIAGCAAGNFYHGILLSFTGAFGFGEPMRGGYVLGFLLCAVLMGYGVLRTDHRKASIAGCLFGWIVLFYALPAFYRAPHFPYDAFIEWSRFRYFPCFAAAGLWALCFSPVISEYRKIPSLLKSLLMIFLLTVLVSNFSAIRYHQKEYEKWTRNTETANANFLTDLRNLLKSHAGPVQIMDRSFWGYFPIGSAGIWMGLKGEDLEDARVRVRVLITGKDRIRSDRPVFWADRDGHLVARRPKGGIYGKD